MTTVFMFSARMVTGGEGSTTCAREKKNKFCIFFKPTESNPSFDNSKLTLLTTEINDGFSQMASTLHQDVAGLLGKAPRISNQPGPLIFLESRNCSRLLKKETKTLTVNYYMNGNFVTINTYTVLL